jgi:hypothetical protein
MKLTTDQLAHVKKLLESKGDAGDVLDEMVHDVFSRQASNLNNQGQDAQIEFLAEGFSFKNFNGFLKYMGLEG